MKRGAHPTGAESESPDVSRLRHALRRPALRIEAATVPTILLYLAAANLVINPIVVRAVASRDRLADLQIDRLFLAFNLGSLVLTFLLLAFRTRIGVVVRVWHVLLLVVFLPVCGEGFLRFVLFSPRVTLRFIERPGLYADADADDDYWVLYHYFSGAPYQTPGGNVHPDLGWVQGNGGELGVVSDRYYRLADVERRPLLFFGDSFVAGATEEQDRIPQQMDAALHDFTVLNYGVGGYGTDQIALRLKMEVGKFEGKAPLLFVGVLHADMDRSLLRFRISQKPYYTIESGQLRLHRPAYSTNQEFLDRYEFRARSFLIALIARLFHHALGRESGNPPRRREINRLIFHDLWEFIRARGLTAYIVPLYDRPTLELAWQGRRGQREQELREILASEGLPALDTRDAMVAALRRRALEPRQVFLDDGHYNAMGNRMVADILVDFVRNSIGDGGPRRDRLLDPADPRTTGETRP